MRAFVAIWWLALFITTRAQSTCPAGAFPHNISGLQCLNMQPNPAMSARACCAACLEEECTVWNFSPDHGTQSCWLWHKPGAPKCYPPAGTWKIWLGGYTCHDDYSTISRTNTCHLQTHSDTVI